MSPQRAGRRYELRREAARLRRNADIWAGVHDVTELQKQADRLDQDANQR